MTKEFPSQNAPLLRFVPYGGDGARASARFNGHRCETLKTASPLALFRLKRRERRAPLPPVSDHSILRASIISMVHATSFGFGHSELFSHSSLGLSHFPRHSK